MTDTPRNITPPSLAERLAWQWSRLRKKLRRKRTDQLDVEAHEIRNYEQFVEVAAPLHESIIKLRKKSIIILWAAISCICTSTIGIVFSSINKHWFFVGLNIATMILNIYNIHRIIHLIESTAEEHTRFHQMEAMAMQHLPPKDPMMPE